MYYYCSCLILIPVMSVVASRKRKGRQQLAVFVNSNPVQDGDVLAGSHAKFRISLTGGVGENDIFTNYTQYPPPGIVLDKKTSVILKKTVDSLQHDTDSDSDEDYDPKESNKRKKRKISYNKADSKPKAIKKEKKEPKPKVITAKKEQIPRKKLPASILRNGNTNHSRGKKGYIPVSKKCVKFHVHESSKIDEID